MNTQLFQEFDAIIKASQDAFHYAEEHFEELMAREVAHVLYGPSVYGTGIAMPSRHIISDKARILRINNRRKNYTEYYFNKNWDLLYSRSYLEKTLDCTMLHFWIGNTNYARYFYKDTNDFYTDTTFVVKYVNKKPMYCALADRSRLLIEYLTEIVEPEKRMVQYTCYDYYPYRVSKEPRTEQTRTIALGDPNTPLTVCTGFYEPVNMDFSAFEKLFESKSK